ncbi:MAG TPA: CbrC family protein [Phytomonospora sp.]
MPTTPAPEAAIARLEERLGRRLPEAMRARLAAENGGPLPHIPAAPDEDWRLLPVLDGSDRKAMKRTAEDARPLPEFRYHPDPLATGSVRPSVTRCPVCEHVTGFAYATTPYGPGTVRNICPWCIADGSAAARFGASFCDDFPLLESGLPHAVVVEVCERTPGFASFQQEEWQSCCGDACAFEGLLAPEDFATLDDATLLALNVPPDRLDDWRSGYTGDDYGVFGFRCLRCGDRRYWVDVS